MSRNVVLLFLIIIIYMPNLYNTLSLQKCSKVLYKYKFEVCMYMYMVK